MTVPEKTHHYFQTPLKRVVFVVIVLSLIGVSIAGYVLLPHRGEYDFQLHQKVSQSSDLRITFPEVMDHHSVEQHIQLPSDLQATGAWSDNTYILTPAQKLIADHVYQVRIDAAAVKDDGLPLGRDLVYTFTVTGAPVLAASVPTGSASNLGPNTDIVLIFDRPVIPLSQVQGLGGKFQNWPVTIEPPVAGSWKWLGTTTATFEVSTPLRKATKYTVTVPAGIAVVSGETTERDFSWSFETERPRVLSVSPAAGSQTSGPTTTLSVTFNQEMDPALAKNFIQLENRTAKISLPIRSFSFGKEVLKKQTIIDKKTLVLALEKPLVFGADYRLSVLEGLKAAEGDLGIEKTESVIFSTVGDFAVKTATYDARYNSLRIDVTNPVDVATVLQHVSFIPKLVLSESTVNAYNLYDGERIEIFPAFAPSTKYTVTFDANMTDTYSQKLRTPWTHTFETAPLEPSVFVYPKQNQFGIFEKSKKPMMYLNHVNISELDLELGKVSFQKFLAQRKSDSDYYQNSKDINNYVDSVKIVALPSTAKKNIWDITALDLEKQLSPLTPGMYALSLRAPEWKSERGEPLQDFRLFAVTDLHITLKFSGDKALVWVTNIQTGEPVQNAKISFYALSGKKPVSGTTNDEGIFEATLRLQDFKNRDYDYIPEFWVTAETGTDFAFTGNDWNTSFQPYQFDSSISTDFKSDSSPAFRAPYYLYTERPLYGAGDTVYFKGITRLLDWNGAMSLPSTASRSISVSVDDADGKQIYAKTLKLSAFGSFSDKFTLAPEASLGSYSIHAKILPDSDIDREMYANFSVLAYRKPEYKISVTSDKEEYKSNETSKVLLSGQYYFGAPMSAAKVQWRVTTTDYFFNKNNDDWYSFGEQNSWCWYRCEREQSEFTSGEGTLDATGRLSIDLPTNLEGKKTSQVMSVEADITDQNNQVVSGRTDYIVHKANVYVGIRSDEYGAAAGQKIPMKIITLLPDGSPKEKTSVELNLYARTWNVTKQKGVDGEYYYDSESTDTFIQKYSVVTGENGKGVSDIVLPKGGEYVAVAVAKDEDGRESKASWSLYAWSDSYFNWPRTNNDRMDILLDKPSYSSGDTAKLLIKSPYQGKGVKALVTVERENVLTSSIIDIVSNAQVIDIPVTEDRIPVAYVSVVVVKPRIGETFDDQGIDTGAPSFKVGYAKLLVDTAPKKLSVTVRTDKERYVPGDTVHATIEAVDTKGAPVEGEFSLSVVDLSLIDLTGFSMPDLVSSFYYERGLGVITSNMMTYLLERFKPGSKGGGGGDGELKKRGNFLDTAYWNPTIVTDKNGQATVSFTLPDNLTTWQLLALGSTKDHRFGGKAKTIIETKHVIVRSVRPRFAVAGDKAILGAIVHNYLDHDETFTVSLVGKGFTHTGPSTQKVFVPKDGNIKVGFPVTFSSDLTSTFNFSAKSAGAVDEIEESIPIYRFGVQQTVATTGVVVDRTDEKVVIPTKKDAPEGDLSVTIAPTLAVYLPSALQFLSEFPYGCAEQTVSSLIPNIALKQLQNFEEFSYVPSSELQKNVTVAFQKLYAFQRGDGGFGYFQGSDRSYPYLTAYVLYGLKIASDAGFAVDQSVTGNALNYLKNAARANAQTYDIVSRAYVAYVLSLYSATNASEVTSLFEARKDLPLHAKAHLAIVLQKAAMNAKAKTLLEEILSTVRVDTRGAHFEETSRGWYESMNTDSRTTAIVLQSILEIDPTNILVPKIIRGMLASRHDGRWDTTQSTAQSILAFVQFLKKSQELNFDFSAGVELDGKSILKHEFTRGKLEKLESSTSINDLVRGATVSLAIGKEGTGNLYYDAVLSYFYTPEKIEPAEEGIGIQRETTPLNPADKKVVVGSLQKVRLTITVPETRHFVAVESMLAGGFEPVDLGYATSQKNLLENAVNADGGNWIDYYRNQTWRFTHIEFRDDRIFLFAEELPAGVYRYEYLERATTPGTFRERPAKVWEMYYPETFGQSEGGWVTIAE